MQATILSVYPVAVGQRKLYALFGSGPASYVNGVGDPILLPSGTYLDAICGAEMTLSGNYVVRPQPSAVGTTRATWLLRWFYTGGQGVDSIAIATAGTGQNNGTFNINGAGGGGSGAVVQITIAGGVITAAKVIAPGTGYTSVPTFTVAQGGTPGTLTATIGATASVEVGNGVNLSGEQLQFGALGGDF